MSSDGRYDDNNGIENEELLPNNNNYEKANGDFTPNTTTFVGNPTSPAAQVKYLLLDNEDDDIQFGQFNPLFCQMDALIHFDDGAVGWKERSRWLKYEERVDDGDRWSKPHVSTTSLHSLMEIRKNFQENKGEIILDLDVSHGCLHQAADSKKSKKSSSSNFSNLQTPTLDAPCDINHFVELVTSALQDSGRLTASNADQLKNVLTAPHKHQHRHGKKVEGSQEKKKLLAVKQDKTDDRAHAYPSGVKPTSLSEHKPNKQFGRKLAGGTEAANILVGQVDFLDEPLMVIVRLKESAILGDMTEVDCPTRFVYICVGPPESSDIRELEEMGRGMAGLFTDKVFLEVAYKCGNSEQLLHGMDEYIDGLTVLPPSVWDPSTRLEPPEKTINEKKLQKRLDDSQRYTLGQSKVDLHGESHDDPTLRRTGRLFGGMINDIKRRYPQMISDYTDGIHLQCLAAVVFLYFACVTPIITFGGLMGSATDNYMGTMESMLSGAICGLIYHIFAGQPLTIVGATGPMLVFEGILYQLCVEYGWHFLSFRFYVGIWIAIILLLFVAFDLSALVSYITRFTEESFSVLISLIFIAEAFKKASGITKYYPMHTNTIHEDVGYKCYCVEPPFTNATEAPPQVTLEPNTTYVYEKKNMWDTFNYSVLVADDCVSPVDDKLIVAYGCLSTKDCLKHSWVLEGPACEDKGVTDGTPDVFLFSMFLFLGTFGIAYTLRTFRNSNFFPTFVRNTVADFAVFIAICICVGVDISLGIDTPKLKVPSEVKPSRDDRGWLVNPLDCTHWWLIPLALVPAILATILVFLDQQITAVIVNRKDHKLKKGHGYHLDLFILALLIIACAVLGLPWFLAATVRSITHVKALLKQSEHRAPGEKPAFLGVREQRLTGVCIHILIGCSVLLTVVLKYVPMPVLYGVFLYMGVTSLQGVQFFERILLFFMPTKYQPDFAFLRHVPMKRVHIFTAIQVLSMAIMWTLKSIKAISITFPVMILALCFIRKGMEWFFTPTDLYWLDHLLPEPSKKKKDGDIDEKLELEKTEFSKV